MNAALLGSVSSSAAALRGMLRGGLEVAGVLGLDRAYSAGVSDYVDLEPLAAKAGVPFVGFRKVIDPQVAGFLEKHRPDWLFVIGLSQLVPAELRGMAGQGAVGFHPTPLPEGRGRAPVAWTILKQRPAAVNLFFLTDEADAGDIIEQRPVEVRTDDYAADLIARTNVVLEQAVADLAPAFATGVVPRHPQDHSRATQYPRRRPEDGLITWSEPAEDIHRMVRAVSRPYPGAFTHAGGTKLMIWRADIVEGDEPRAAPGEVVAIRNGIPVVQTGRGRLALTEIEWPSGDRPPLSIGTRLG
jgi:methionyl-tRNA formyltransferase